MTLLDCKRPIALAALKLDILCGGNEKDNDQIWQLTELLYGENNVSVWKENGGTEKIREMFRKNLEVFQNADTTGQGFRNRLAELYTAGEFVDETGEDFLESALASDDEELIDNLADLIIEKMCISERVAAICLASLARDGDA